MREVVIVDGARSAFGKMGGELKKLIATDIGAFVVKGLINRAGINERGVHIDDLMSGSAKGDANTRAQARYILQAAGLPFDVSGTYVEMQCGSGITALNHAAWKIIMGMSDVAIVGGVETYSQTIAKFSMSQEPYKLIPPTAVKLKMSPIPEDCIDMISISDLMAQKWGITREACDEFSYNSQQRLQKAYKNGITGSEIIPYVIPATKKSPEISIDKDEHPRPDTTIEMLKKLKPVNEGGVTTAGNASGRNDGAAFLLVMTAEKAKEYGYTPIAKWVTGADVGCPPRLMGIGPSYSNQRAMKQAGLKIADIGVFECNEAFAAQNLSVVKDMEDSMGEKIDMEKWNPNGGAIAIGHPNGASGPRITMFAMRQLEKTGGRYGVIASCCGGGHGTTTIIENLRR